MFEADLLKLLNDQDLNAISYGDTTPHPPYVVVQPDRDVLARGTVFRIYTHRAKGQQFKLNEDIELIINTLDGTEFEYRSTDYNPRPVVNDDKTLSREISFLIVSKY